MRYFLSLAVPFFILGLLPSCQSSVSPSETSAPEEGAGMEALDTLTLALDWRPNALHSGIFYAQQQGWYDSLHLHLQWFSPEVDDYGKLPSGRWRIPPR